MRSLGSVLSKLTAKASPAAGVLVALTAGCGAGSPAAPAPRLSARQELAAELAQARARWRGASLERYSYRLERKCYCLPQYTAPAWLDVAGGRVVRAVREDTGEDADPAGYPGVEGLFDLVQAALEQDAHEIRVAYHSTLGYPLSIFVDRDDRIADEEFLFEASGLETTRP